ncbi:MAG: EamA family transporter [Acidobacteriaceae bacterium]|nr:EamA family transporter [Acidobacteriaceae bacterium]
MSWFAWAVLSAVFAAATAILAKIGVANVDPNLATAYRTSVVVVFAWAIAFLARQPNTFRVSSPATWVFLTLSGLATALSWLCYFRALQLGPASRVAPVDKFSVILVIVFSATFLHEKLTWGKALGGVLIVSGLITVAFD